MRSSEIICECGHTAGEHQENGCWYFGGFGGYRETPHHCDCMIPDETVVELHTLRKADRGATDVLIMLDGLELDVKSPIFKMYEILKDALKIDFED